MIAGKMAVDLIPQGALIERIRAGGYGLGGVLTPTGVGTVVEEGKQKVQVNGKTYLVETALNAQFALIEAFLADYLGNLSYANRVGECPISGVQRVSSVFSGLSAYHPKRA